VAGGRGLGTVEGGGGGAVVGGGGGRVVVVEVVVVVGSATAARSSGIVEWMTWPHPWRANATSITATSGQRTRLFMVATRRYLFGPLALAHPGGVFVLARHAPGRVVVLGTGAALGAELDTDLGAALEGPSLFEAPMSTFFHVPPLPGSACVTR